MTDESKTTIVFSGGTEVRVAQSVDEVEAQLSKVRGVSNEQRENTGFAAFTTSRWCTRPRSRRPGCFRFG